MRRLQLSPLILLIALAACVPAGTAAPTATETPPPAPTPTSTSTPPVPTPTSTPPATPTPTPTAQPDQIRRVPSPDGRWTALVNETRGSLDLEGSEGESVSIFSPGSTVATAE